MIETETRRQRALVVHPRNQQSLPTADYELEEAQRLAKALDLDIAASEVAPLREVRPNTYFAGGKVSELKDRVKEGDIDLVIVNASLSPVQQRNLETSLKAKVMDRQGLILEIFARRAATSEGRLQVELARQTYERSRLVRTWTHLERQRGGTGFLGGPGERQIESDRRMLDERISRLKSQLEQVRRTRGLQRKQRSRAPERVVALVGYTNAGKSTLFNRLTDSEVFAEDLLFATLDTTMRVLPLPNGKPCLLSDTVGFVSNLPTELIAAFQATLEEVRLADLVVHVRDISDPLTHERREDVMAVLDDISAGPAHDQPYLEVWNKADLLTKAKHSEISDNISAEAMQGPSGNPPVLVSALSGQGCEDLKLRIESILSEADRTLIVTIPPSDSAARAWIFEKGDVLNETIDDTGVIEMVARLALSDCGKLVRRFPAVNATVA